MKNYANITCGVLTPIDLSKLESSSRLIDLLDRYKWALPTQISNHEPIRHKYTDKSDVLTLWSDPFLWKNSKNKIEGSVWFGKNQKHSCIYINSDFNNNKVRQNEWVDFLIDACKTFEADFAYIHLTTYQEITDTSLSYVNTHAIDRGITTKNLLGGIPNLCWGMVLGRPYRNMIDNIKNCSIPFPVIDISSELVYIQITPDISDIITNYDVFNNNRISMKNKIGSHYFSNGNSQLYTPQFVFA